ncbi:hypothetical protein D3C81_2105870 [compost metagenome]
MPVRISVAEAEDSRTSRILFDFSSMTLFSKMEAPVMISDHRTNPTARPTTVGSLSRNDTSPPERALGENTDSSGRKRSVCATTAGSMPPAAKT